MFGDASAPALQEKIHNVWRRPEGTMLRYWSTPINGAMYEGERQFVEMTFPIKIMEALAVFAMESLISLVESGRRNYK